MGKGTVKPWLQQRVDLEQQYARDKGLFPDVFFRLIFVIACVFFGEWRYLGFIAPQPPGEGGGVLLEILDGGVAAQFSKSWPSFKPKNVIFFINS